MGLNQAVDNLCIYTPDFQHYADKFLAETDGSKSVHKVETMEELKTALTSYNAVKFLEICLHGTPGMVHLTDGTAIVGSYLNKMATNQLFLQKNARILFDNCSIGAGDAGDKFMDSIGAGMLKDKGGFVGATTVENEYRPLLSFLGIHMKPLSFGRLKVRRYDETGKLIASETVDRHGIKR
jgi:hypothetical protein